jgi:hypothetical protein
VSCIRCRIRFASDEQYCPSCASDDRADHDYDTLSYEARHGALGEVRPILKMDEDVVS